MSYFYFIKTKVMILNQLCSCFNLGMSDINLGSFKNKKIALVLSGGVVKAAAWHLGIALALEELGFVLKSNKNSSSDEFNLERSLEVGTYVGSSAGALVSLFLACGTTPHEVINSIIDPKSSKLKSISYKDMFHIQRNRIKPPKPDLFHPLEGLPKILRTAMKPFLGFAGPFSTEGIRNYILENIIHSDNFEDIVPDLFIVASQLDHSRKVIFSKYNYPNPSHDSTAVYYTGHNISTAAAASMAVPPFYAPYPVFNPQTNKYDYYIDGEIRETLSTHVAEDNKCDIIISSWTHTPYHYHDEVGSLINYGLSSIAIQSIYLLIQKKIVASRAKRASAIDIMNTVNEYMKNQKFANSHRQDLMAILETKLKVNPNVKLIDIYPEHEDYKLFFSNSFTLNPDTNSYIVRSAYKQTMKVLSKVTQ
jgi:predicted acylesterase/phospholipase RssA